MVTSFPGFMTHPPLKDQLALKWFTKIKNQKSKFNAHKSETA